MSPTHRHNHRIKTADPTALAARLPRELRSLDGIRTPEDYRGLYSRVADWIDTQIPGRGQELSVPVLTAAGLTAAEFYRRTFCLTQ